MITLLRLYLNRVNHFMRQARDLKKKALSMMKEETYMSVRLGYFCRRASKDLIKAKNGKISSTMPILQLVENAVKKINAHQANTEQFKISRLRNMPVKLTDELKRILKCTEKESNLLNTLSEL